jgi:hypothetical protein
MCKWYEILMLRHQLNVLRRRSPRRVAFSNVDRVVFVGLYRLVPKVLDALKIVQPETLVSWHRAGFRAYWRWRSRRQVGRPRIAADIRQLIFEMSVANPLWERFGFTASCSSLVSMSARPRWQNTWPREDGHRRKVGRPSFAIMPMVSHR